MPLSAWLKPPRQVFVLFLGVAVVSFATLGTLAWQLLNQDRDLEVQRRRGQLESTADQLVAAMRQSLAELQAHVGGAEGAASGLPPDVVAITIAGDRVISRPAGRLLYYPIAPSSPASRAIFADAERLEFSGDAPGAAAAYTKLAAQSDRVARAGALMRLGRTHRRSGAWTAALAAYRDLDTLGATIVEDLPAALVASVGRLDTFKSAGRTDDERREAERLAANLGSGQWHLTKAQFNFYFATARASLPNAAGGGFPAVLLSDVAADLWRQRGAERSLTRDLASVPSGKALVVWTATPARLDAVIAGPGYLATLGREGTDGTRWAISHEGQALVGTAPATGTAAVRASVTSGLPWTVHVFPNGERLGSPLPRTQILWLLAIAAAVLGAGWYFIFRSVARERHVARLQSDFVAAVSHEFRSPLTSLTHAADLLAQDRLSSDVTRRQTHQVLVRDTARLRGLVEGLLAFGRLEAGAPFQFEHTDIDALVRSTVDDFRDDPSSEGYAIEVSSDTGQPLVRIDREAVARAIRNLLDNAVKYSPGAHRIEVSVRLEVGAVVIAVRDHGIGIPIAEQRAIFDPFVRGAESTSRRIRGTGIGLAMVKQIARGHGGDVTVTSEQGAGSEFALRLPATLDRAEVTR